MSIPRIGITAGEPTGIGPDIVLMLAQQTLSIKLVIFADPDLLQQRAKQLCLTITIHQLTTFSDLPTHQPGHLWVLPSYVAQAVVTGQLNVANVSYVLTLLKQGLHACLNQQIDALVTAPVHKGIINEAGQPFTGHTEFFADHTQSQQVVMMLATSTLKVALVTTHLPLAQVSQAITAYRLENIIRILHTELLKKFAIKTPRIAVCGLNPHAGEGGYLGLEEQTIMMPVIEKLRHAGFSLVGPVPADTAFTPSALATVDVVLAMYHDQGLPVLKHQGFGQAVNITLGLPIIRVSVDHGTALELAGTGQASANSLIQAVKIASEMVYASS